ncbi:lantibiotic dehydratase [Micromonospora sp. WMMC273]|uniref:lantibiotic dehydratase n=1 Tax=Micromonospora sp. WMMC273 TaxID=3015157 RepID=UPI0022B64781|nr:lantibiotic dehydratase [Micromonospora sp. WMMC273]MCZ7474835.1 lantibiotic dehydratase [Micromonospora sp. WMMC273]
MPREHLTSLPGTPWHVWRSALLRSAGFPADGMSRFAAPALAEAADRHLRGDGDAAEFAAAFDAAAADLGQAVYDIACDDAFRTALTWQNPAVLLAVDAIRRDGPHAPRNLRRRHREEVVAKYWQRYCLKNDTVGFFGPICWIELGGSAPIATVRQGAALTRTRKVFLERWGLDALAAAFARVPGVRDWLPVRLAPHLSLRDRVLRHPHHPPQTLPAATAALLTLARRGPRVADLVAALLADPASGFRRAADVHAQLDDLAGRGVLRIGFDLPVDLTAEDALREQLAAIGDDPVRERVLGDLATVSDLRDAVAAADGPDALAAAMSALDRRFVELTGRDARQQPGEVYAGRTLCHLETVRDLDVRFGDALLARLAPLEPLLLSARWLTAAIGQAYADALAALYRDLAAESATDDVPVADLWFLAQAVVFGTDPPAAAVTAEFLDRWAEVLGLADADSDARELRFDAAALTERVAAAFPADAPGWAAARIHSPDVHVCAPDEAALLRGDFTVVLGELHVALAAFDTHFFAYGHPDPRRLRDGMRADLPGGRVRLLPPVDWPRHTARIAEWLHGPADAQLGFVDAPGADPDRLVPITALTVRPDDDGTLTAHADDGRRWPLLEVFAPLFDHQVFDTWKLAGNAGRTPRITVDGLVLVRETWRTTVGETGLHTVKGERERYLTVRRWRLALGLPERIFVRVDTELKPSYVDLTSGVYTRLLCTLLRGAHAKGGDEVGLTVTELLPGPDDAWLTDGTGRAYASELRLQIVDPAQVR